MELEQLCVGSPSPFLGPGLFLGLGTPLNLPEKTKRDVGPRLTHGLIHFLPLSGTVSLSVEWVFGVAVSKVIVRRYTQHRTGRQNRG